MNAKHAPKNRAEARALRAATADAARPWYPAQRALRSIVGALVVLVPLVNGLAAATIAYLNSQTDVAIPPVVFVWLNAIVAATALVIGLVSRLMAVPGFNAFLTRLGLGTAPRSAIVIDEEARLAYVAPDEHVVAP
jgi:hypothetical protein